VIVHPIAINMPRPFALLTHSLDNYTTRSVAKGKPYNETVDVFSICILCWQLFALNTPYEGYTMKMFESRVIEGGARPMIDPKWGTEICDVMKKGFVDNPNRPGMDKVCQVLKDEINKLSDQEIEDMLDASRKSMMSAD
jgi:hypothetical protein